ncbi:MAG: pyridoxal phosphate-dependent class II aminotransferase [Eubacteriales bacterium]|nr:pyridoxal phosphate-dependent class II aminotransferase [Eubacteriales bacterium]
MKKHVHGGDVYRYEGCLDFSANCNPLGTPDSVKEAVIQSLEGMSHYPLVGCGPLREAIGAYEGVKGSQVICGNGAAELIFSLCRAMGPKRALVAAPTFAEYELALDSVGCQTEHFYLREEEGFVLGEAFLEALSPGLDVVFLCNPNNPTGILIPRELLRDILEACARRGIFLVVDECFLDFVEDRERHTLSGELESRRNLFLLKAFTKRYAMAGIRLGYGLCGDPALLERMEAVNQPWNVSSMAQAAGLAALKEEAYVERGRELVAAERAYLRENLRALGLRIYPSAANYVFFQGPENLFERCVERGILLRDCSNYSGLRKGFCRAAVKRREENRRLIQVLERILKG